jgi:hypothetical protein
MKAYRVKVRATGPQQVARVANTNKKVGQSIVEFALVAPIVLLLIFGIIDIARLIQAQVSVDNAAREGLRFAITGQQERDPSDTFWITRTVSIVNHAKAGLTGLPMSNTNDPTVAGFNEVRINPPDAGGSGQIVEITVYYDIEMLTPLVNVVLPRVLVHGYERGINEAWGAVQSFDHANIPPTPVPLPTWTPLPTNTPTNTPVFTATATRTRTPTATRTVTPTATSTLTSTATAVSTVTPTPTP